MITADMINKAMEENKDLLIDMLSEMIKTESITGNEEKIGEVYKKWIEKFGFETQVVREIPGRPNVIGWWRGGEGPGFVYNGHMDTHPVPDPDLWDFPPFSRAISDGHMYGKGTSDMKGGNAAFLMAMKLLKDLGFAPKGDVEMAYVCDEQNGGTHGIKYLLDNGYIKGKYGINGEPTYTKLLVKHKGVNHYDVKIIGESYSPAFSGKDKFFEQSGVDAIEKVGKVLVAFEKYKKEVLDKRVDPDLGKSILAVTTIHAGEAVNLIAGDAVMTLDRRINPGETDESVLAELVRVLEDVKKEDPEFKYEITPTTSSPIFDVSVDSDAVKAVCRAYEEIEGCPPEIICVPWGSDATNIIKETGVQMPILGPGYMECVHNERVKLDWLFTTVKVYALTVAKLLG